MGRTKAKPITSPRGHLNMTDYRRNFMPGGSFFFTVNLADQWRRSALELTVQASLGPIHIVNTHLEYYSRRQREAQIIRLLDLQSKPQAPQNPRSRNTLNPTEVRR
jgi:endonuclease/exonuclease/phosphatase family metal-dependent hydrolase